MPNSDSGESVKIAADDEHDAKVAVAEVAAAATSEQQPDVIATIDKTDIVKPVNSNETETTLGTDVPANTQVDATPVAGESPSEN